MTPPLAQAPRKISPSLFQLVALFGTIGATAFGGGSTSHITQGFTSRGWLTPEECVEALTWCQSLPGPNTTNLAAFLGWRFKGLLGSLLCTIALLAPGACVLLGLARGLTLLFPGPVVTEILEAVAAGAVGLILGTAMQLANPTLTSKRRWVVVALTFALVSFAKLPAPLVLVLMTLVLFVLERPGAAGGGFRH